MSTIVGSSSEESGFVNVMKILEEERYCMERRLDLITKVDCCVSKVKETYWEAIILDKTT